MGTQESRGLKKGVVVNIEATVAAIQRALEEAELMADCKIQHVFTGIAGSHIKSFNSTGMVAIKDKEVTALDMERAIETARAMPIPTDQQVLHILTQEFIDRRPGRHPRSARHVRRAPGSEGAHRDRRGARRRRTSSSACAAAGWRCPIWCCSRSPRAWRCSPRTRRSSASRSSTSAAAPPTSRCSRTARSGTPR